MHQMAGKGRSVIIHIRLPNEDSKDFTSTLEHATVDDRVGNIAPGNLGNPSADTAVPFVH